MTRHRFRGTDSKFVSMITESSFDGQRLKLIVIRCRSAVSVDVADLFRFNAGIRDRLLLQEGRSGTSFVWHRDMKSVGGHAIANNFCIDRRTSASRKFQLFKNHDAGAFADDETVPIPFEGT